MRRIRQGADPFSRADFRTLLHHGRGGGSRPLDLRTRRTVAFGVLLGCTAFAIATFRIANGFTDGGQATAADKLRAPSVASSPSGSTKGSPTKGSLSQGPTSNGSSSNGSSTGSSEGSSAGASKRPSVHPTGLFSRAPGASVRHGSGSLKTYRVEVETGTGQSASAFAAAVDATLADRASWSGHGLWSLQRAQGKVDFVIRLATPATVDKVCATVGLSTRGYVSCQAGRFVMINLDRWLRAVPDYRGDVAMYRHYVINHEVGHQLGYDHRVCPGPGRPAPVMQQQTYGLRGCVANGWPYVNGKLV